MKIFSYVEMETATNDMKFTTNDQIVAIFGGGKEFFLLNFLAQQCYGPASIEFLAIVK